MTARVRIGVFSGEGDLLRAVRAVRARGWVVRDAFAPYAVHGLDEAMGLARTRLVRVCLVLGLVGFVAALAFQLWTFGWSWPLIVGGKDTAAVPALIPISFEVTVLFAALGTVLALFARSRLWPGREARLPAAGVTDDRFAVAVEAEAADLREAEALLRESGAVEVRTPEEEEG